MAVIGEIGVIKRLTIHIRVWKIGLVPIASIALKLDHVSGVVGDDVHKNLNSAVVSLGNQTAEVFVGAQVGVNLRKVENPVTVIARGVAVEIGGVRLNSLVLIDGANPYRRHTHVGQIIQL